MHADPETAWTALIHLARREGFAVQRGTCATADGFTTWCNRKIRIKPDATPAHAVTALAHQLGHVLLHRHIAQHEPSGTVPCTGIRKVEADSVAYLTAAQVGIDAAEITFPHVASWAGSDPRARPAATIQAVTARIAAATATITERLNTAGVTGGEHNLTGLIQSRPPAAQPVPLPRAATLPIADARAGPSAPPSELIRVHDNAAAFFRSQLPGSWVPGYLARRGLSSAIQQQWLAGYAPAAWDAMTRHLRAAGYPDTLIEAAGLGRRSRRGTLIDTFRDRAMFPIRSPEGTIVAFIGRARPDADPGTPKYLNSPSTSLYDKSEMLFGLAEARGALAQGARPVIVEGPLDAIAVTTADQGRYTGVAPCGTALTARHAAALGQAADLRTVGVTVAFDPDEAGKRAAVRAYHLLVPHTDKLATVKLPEGQDPAQILAGPGPAALAEALARSARPLPDMVVNAELHHWNRRHVSFPEGQLGALRAIAPVIAAMPPAHVGRQVARLAAVLQLDHATVTKALTDALTTLTDQAISSRHEARSHQPISRSLPPAGTRAADHDSAYTSRQSVERAASTDPVPAPARRASTSQPRLTTRPVRG